MNADFWAGVATATFVEVPLALWYALHRERTSILAVRTEVARALGDIREASERTIRAIFEANTEAMAAMRKERDTALQVAVTARERYEGALRVLGAAHRLMPADNGGRLPDDGPDYSKAQE